MNAINHMQILHTWVNLHMVRIYFCLYVVLDPRYDLSQGFVYSYMQYNFKHC